MFNNVTRTKVINSINAAVRSAKFLGVFALMFIMAGAIVAAPAASAASASNSTPSSSARYGKLTVTVVDANRGDAVALAAVQVADRYGKIIAKGETDASGWFSTYLFQGAYKVYVTADGYKDYTQAFDITAGGSTNIKAGLQSLNVVPSPVADAEGKLALFVTETSNDTTNGVGIAGASVLVFDQSGAVVAKGLTDQSGYFSAMLPVGQYKITVNADGYKEHRQAIEITANQTAKVAATLESDASGATSN